MTPELSTCCKNHICKTDEGQQESFCLQVLYYIKSRNSSEEHSPTNVPPNSLTAIEEGCSKRQLRNSIYATQL